jgi:hypothetical protein
MSNPRCGQPSYCFGSSASGYSTIVQYHKNIKKIRIPEITSGEFKLGC